MPKSLIDLQIAWRNLTHHARRTRLLVGAIAVVTCMFVLLSALSTGIRRTLLETATTLTTGHINVGGFYKPSSGRQALPLLTDYPGVLRDVKRALPELGFAVNRGRGWVKVVSDHGALQRGLGGVDIEQEPQLRRMLEVSSGDIMDLAQPNTVLVFEAQAKKLQLAVGDMVTLSAQTTRGVANTLDCRVVAIGRDLGWLSGWSVYVSNASLRKLFQRRDDVGGVVSAYFKRDDVDLEAVAARLRTALQRDGYRVLSADPRPFWLKIDALGRQSWTGQKLDVTTWKDELSFIMWTLQGLQALSTLLVLILVAIVSVGVMNTLWIAMRERTREIGTLRAIGMQRGGVVRLFLLESAMLGALGSSVGCVLGVLCAVALNQARMEVPASMQLFLMRDTLVLAVEPPLVLTACALLTLLTCVAALYPSVRAARLKPVDALAHFG